MKPRHFVIAGAALGMLCFPALASPDQEPAGVMAVQGETRQALIEHPQSVMFLESNETDPKAAVANLLITQVGLPLLTIGLSTQMRMWNPYMGETFNKATNLGKGMLLGHGTDTHGFEYELLPGLSAGATLKEGPAEFIVPLEAFGATEGGDFQPVLVRLESREKDKARLIASRRVLLKEAKKGRFDLKPTVERQETEVQQQAIPIEVRRENGHTYHIATKGPLQAGEYALLIRQKSDAGEYTSNVALRPSAPMTIAAPAPAAPAQGMSRFAPKAGFMMGRHAMPQPEQAEQHMTGFLAWDFRVGS